MSGLYVELTGAFLVNLWRQTYMVDESPESRQPAFGALLGLGLGFESSPPGR